MVDRERAAKAAEALGNYRRTDEEKYFEDLSRCFAQKVDEKAML